MKLDQYLKWMGWVGTGGEAKQHIQAGAVTVNGAVETRRGRQLLPGDHVVLGPDSGVVDENVAPAP
ncbi:MAG: RNA-binding S4 domain-containing protein [Synechococcus sp.]